MVGLQMGYREFCKWNWPVCVCVIMTIIIIMTIIMIIIIVTAVIYIARISTIRVSTSRFI